MKSIFAAVAALAALAASAAGATPAMKSADQQARRPAHLPVDRALTVLFDQSEDGDTATSSQNYETANDGLDDQGADDFTVPVGQTWLVREIDVGGRYFEGSGAPSVNVFIYFHKKGPPSTRFVPGNIRNEFDNLPAGDDGSGNFAITLPKAVKLHAGTYWLSVQVNMDSSAKGRWGWENADGKKGVYRAVWRNPLGGWGQSECTDWHRNDECTGNVDFQFTLRGDLQG